MNQFYLGVDPGTNGALAWLGPGGPGFVKMPATERDLMDAARIVADQGECLALIERMGSIPGQWDAAEKVYKLKTKPSAFGVLMQNYGSLRMALIAAGIVVEEIETKRWQKHYGLLRVDKRETDTAKKNRHKAKAQLLFPTLKITHANADALLIASYCKIHSASLFPQAAEAP